MEKLISLFNTSKPVIGAVHFLPMIGFEGFTDIETIYKMALKDMKALIEGGVNGVIFENNYDYPHKIIVEPETVACMTYLIDKLSKSCTVPFGVSVLWNDYRAVLSIAKVCGGKFVRVPVFVDDVSTEYGNIKGEPHDVVEYRRKIEAENILLLTDIHVKHSKIISKHSLVQSAKLAIESKSDALIITGKWTGDMPDLRDLTEVRAVVNDFPIFIGSGVDSMNAKDLLKFADGLIVSTSLKSTKYKDKVNVRGYEDRIQKSKVKELINSARKI